LISLYPCIYKIIAKIRARRVKILLLGVTSSEKFDFLESKQIHEVVGVAEKGMHTIKTKRIPAMVVKIDFSKAYDRVSWLYLRMMIIHLGFQLPFVNRVMSCILYDFLSAYQWFGFFFLRTRKGPDARMDWMLLFLIPKYVIEKIRKLSLSFLRSRDREKRGITLVKWKRVALPKDMGGWGIKDLSLFSKALSAKCVWRLITVDGLWTQVMIQKYTEPDSVEDWIRSPTKSHQNALIVWKSLILAFPLVGRWLIWKVDKGNKPTR
jgi:hypothetical protein